MSDRKLIPALSESNARFLIQAAYEARACQRWERTRKDGQEIEQSLVNILTGKDSGIDLSELLSRISDDKP